MPTMLLDEIRSQIRDRLRELEPAARESERLEAALAALGGVRQPSSARKAKPSRPAARPRRRASRATPKRAPRGANRAAVLAALAERPGVDAGELSSATGVKKAVLYNLLKALERRGEVVKEPLPGGTSGYRLVESDRAAT
jgi:sugar-specific transcriptional regulator TrmB